MKNLLRISSAMMLTLFLFTSCDKDETSEDEKAKPITLSQMQNSKNPIDEQGTMYFDFLTKLAENNDIGGWDVGQLAEANGIEDWDVGQIAQSDDKNGWDVSKIRSLAMDFNKSKGKDSGEKAQRSLGIQFEVFSNIQMISDAHECQRYPDRCPDYKKYLEEKNKKISGGSDRDRTIKFIEALRDKESVVLANGEMSEEEKEAFFTMATIARHAAGYWFNETLESEESTRISSNMIQLSTHGALTALHEANTKEMGVGTAILTAYVASGRADKE